MTIARQLVLCAALVAMSVVAASLLAGQIVAEKSTAPAAIGWAVDPGDAGPNLPPVGRSLFDQLLDEPAPDAATSGTRGRVPFPLAALVRRIEERLGPDPDGTAPLRRVLIPFSRSLQRNAASPEFLRYPRAVLAVDSQRGNGPGFAAGPLLKDRFFLGYQETAGVLEVISYNEEAGRFEFQVVRDYREGANPRVVYAQRALCVACHQNAAPIFSRQLWDETNANPRIASALRRQGRQFYGFPVDQGVDVLNAFQAAADRANLLAVYQLLWREGCGGPAAGSVERSCRAALFSAVVQEALTGGQGFDASAGAFRKHFWAPFAAAWQARWPHGLAIPNPDLPNRDPLAETPAALRQLSVAQRLGASDAALLEEVVRRSNVPARLEPLEPRAPLETWAPDASTVERLVAGLADFLPRGDVVALDRRLFELGAGQLEPRRVDRAACRFELRRPAGERTVNRVNFACGDAPRGGRAPAESPSLATSGTVFLEGRKIAGGEVEWIALDGRVDLADLAVAGGSLCKRGSAWEMRLRLAQRQSGMHARRPGGDAVEELALTLPAPGAAAAAAPAMELTPDLAGRAELRLLADFSRAESAIGELLAPDGAGTEDAFGNAPFRGGALVGALFGRLGIYRPPRARAAATADTRTPASSTEVVIENLRPFPSSPALRTFLRYCSSCHRTAEPSPPNFLEGGPDQIEAHLAHCAERLFFRLSMWQLDDAHRAKTPMPPIYALRGLEVDSGSWPHHADLRLLTAYAGDLLRRQTGSPPRLDELAARGYEGLRSCLPMAVE